jgi:hypothetical protein
LRAHGWQPALLRANTSLRCVRLVGAGAASPALRQLELAAGRHFYLQGAGVAPEEDAAVRWAAAAASNVSAFALFAGVTIHQVFSLPRARATDALALAAAAVACFCLSDAAVAVGERHSSWAIAAVAIAGGFALSRFALAVEMRR